MTNSFVEKETEKIFNRKISRKLPNEIQKSALRKLNMVHAATIIKDLEEPPGNRPELLRMISKYKIVKGRTPSKGRTIKSLGAQNSRKKAI